MHHGRRVTYDVIDGSRSTHAPFWQSGKNQTIVFACTYTLSAATMRRGDECYSQKLNQRFTCVIKSIGPAGMNCTFLVCNKAKHNTISQQEYVAIAPHVDPLMDQFFWHGLLWLYLIMVAGF
jgi:hypothetical protein